MIFFLLREIILHFALKSQDPKFCTNLFCGFFIPKVWCFMIIYFIINVYISKWEYIFAERIMCLNSVVLVVVVFLCNTVTVLPQFLVFHWPITVHTVCTAICTSLIVVNFIIKRKTILRSRLFLRSMTKQPSALRPPLFLIRWQADAVSGGRLVVQSFDFPRRPISTFSDSSPGIRQGDWWRMAYDWRKGCLHMHKLRWNHAEVAIKIMKREIQKESEVPRCLSICPPCMSYVSHGVMCFCFWNMGWFLWCIGKIFRKYFKMCFMLWPLWLFCWNNQRHQ